MERKARLYAGIDARTLNKLKAWAKKLNISVGALTRRSILNEITELEESKDYVRTVTSYYKNKKQGED